MTSDQLYYKDARRYQSCVHNIVNKYNKDATSSSTVTYFFYCTLELQIIRHLPRNDASQRNFHEYIKIYTTVQNIQPIRTSVTKRTNFLQINIIKMKLHTILILQ